MSIRRYQLKDFIERYRLPEEALEELRELLNESDTESMPTSGHDVVGIPAVPAIPDLMPSLVEWEDDEDDLAFSGELHSTRQELPSLSSLDATPYPFERSRSSSENIATTQQSVFLTEDGMPRSEQGTAENKERFVWMGLLGEGGMGEVFRVRDLQLNRSMAMKVLRRGLQEDESLVVRFLEEAQVCAQLEHPAILPVYEYGRLPDGRHFFTMQEVEGYDLGDIIEMVHRPHAVEEEFRTQQPWNFRRLVESFRKICEAMSYAHSRGVLHRDLKPSNIMVGKHGEVMVVDWGLAKIFLENKGSEQILRTVRSEEPAQHKTAVGILTGTPTYMSPEQAMGNTNLIDHRSDVYSLGAVLYEILSGRPPYLGDNPHEVHMQLLMGPPSPMTRTIDMPAFRSFSESRPEEKGPPLPSALVRICEKAMAREPDKRYQQAADMVRDLDHWLERSQSQERALQMVSEARFLLDEAAQLAEEADSLLNEVNREMKDIAPWKPEEVKRPYWEQEETAQTLLERSDFCSLEAERLLQAAVSHGGHLPEANVALLEYYSLQHQKAEQRREQRLCSLLEQRLQLHLDTLPPEHPSFLHYSQYLQARGRLSLRTEPTDAEVTLYSIQKHHRRQILVREASLNNTPLRQQTLSQGWYVLTIRGEGTVETRLPVRVQRNEEWELIRPGDFFASALSLPSVEDWKENEVFVPAGWFLAGSEDNEEHSFPQQEYFIDSFAMKQFPVTRAEYLLFLNELLEEDEALAEKRAPAVSHVNSALEQEGLFVREEGRFAFAEGEQRQDWPVTQISWQAARHYARWYSQKTGQSWRLPTELEWEKAARGIDGRLYPWGDNFDPSWTCMNESHPNEARACSVHSFEIDDSIYGVRGMAGNVRDWCFDSFEENGPLLSSVSDEVEGENRFCIVRGGAWTDSAKRCRLDYRYWLPAQERNVCVGFRLVRPLDTSEH